ncbi:MAG: hypothetical protein A2158_06615 [Chloroflexi bacterium RBG_13_46_14]|nr:MAG: hypothetical protein A2158_06615 [Chloroflexi bacterium RBG_13_46_14]
MNKTVNDNLLLDTSVFSLLLKKNDSRAALYKPDIQGKILSISFVTVGELYRWAYTHNWGPLRLQQLEDWLHKVVVINTHEEIAKQWARIQSIPGQRHPDNDAWVAACALVHGCILVTHDRDYQNIPGLQIISHLS